MTVTAPATATAPAYATSTAYAARTSTSEAAYRDPTAHATTIAGKATTLVAAAAKLQLQTNWQQHAQQQHKHMQQNTG